MLKTLQSGRALAAISVAAFHLSNNMSIARYGGSNQFADYTKYGNIGVDFFFVLSGFIIFFAHEHDLGKPVMWLRFAYRRFSRLFPIYWLYSAIFITMLFMGAGTDAKLPSGIDEWVTSISLIRFSSASPPLSPAWTLFHELQFYFVFSILILNKRAGIFAMSALALIAIFFYQYPDAYNRTPINVYTSAYSLYFLLGMASYQIYKRHGNGVPEGVIGLTALAICFTLMSPYAPITKLIIAIGFALTLAGAAKMERHYQFRCPTTLCLIGDASYTIYLIHLAFEGLFLKIIFKSNLYPIIGPAATFIITLTLTLAAGCAVYYIVERPLMKWLKGKTPHSPATSAVLKQMNKPSS